ncbi:unnamed protein product [Notodromas monacha]|uniref:Uncharacterized protein n=1 Tax=Notodromas monacha TaxID=399045 RepID=A0A7R9BP64_9CRUS|nr:unnamed protein product [Notodromas monacha]CAG0918251.1 unnamed protein product [Notodromas monacha]
MKFSRKEVSAEDVRKLYKTSADLVSRLDRICKSARELQDLFSVEAIVARQQLCDILSQILEGDENDKYSKKCLDLMWKKIYYDVVNAARQLRRGSRWQDVDKAMLCSHLQAGIGNYEYLLMELGSVSDLKSLGGNFWVSAPCSFIHEPDSSIEKPHRPASMDRIHQCLIALGDLSRYLNDIDSPSLDGRTVNGAMALQFYEAAVLLNPKIGMPFNQIGMLLGHRGDFIGATFNYWRSLSAEQVFEGAVGNLKMLAEKLRNQKMEQPVQALGKSIVLFSKICIAEEDGDDALMIAQDLSDSCSGVLEKSLCSESMWMKLVIILESCLSVFKEKSSDTWGAKVWTVFRVMELASSSLLREISKYLEEKGVWEGVHNYLKNARKIWKNNYPEKQVIVGQEVEDAQSISSDDSADFIIESDTESESSEKTPLTEDKVSDSEFHTPDAISPAPKSEEVSLELNYEVISGYLLEALSKSSLLYGLEHCFDVLRRNVELLRTCGTQLAAFFQTAIDVANLFLIFSKSVPDSVSSTARQLVKSANFLEEFSSIKKKTLRDIRGCSLAKKSELGGASTAVLCDTDEVYLCTQAMCKMVDLLTDLDATGVRFSLDTDCYFLEDTACPVVTAESSEESMQKLCAELTKAYKMSVMAQQYIKSQIVAKKDGPTPCPPYLIPDAAAMTEHLKVVQSLLKSGDRVLIMPRAVWLGLDKLKTKSRKARDAIRWLEQMTKRDDGKFRFQRNNEYMKVGFVKCPKTNVRDSWHVLEVLECCYALAKKGVDVKKSLFGDSEDECPAWESSTVLFLVAGFDVHQKSVDDAFTYVTKPTADATVETEMTALEIAHALGVRMENLKSYYADWKSSMKSK